MREAYRTADRFVTSLFSPSRQRQVRIALACAAFVAAATVCKAATPSPGLAADGWITHPGAMPSPGPSALPGEFVWLEKSYLLTEMRTRLEVPAGR